MVMWEVKGVWRGVTAVSTLRDDLTFIVSVSRLGNDMKLDTDHYQLARQYQNPACLCPYPLHPLDQ